ncbi:MAG: type II toxin-antitoxin system VapC family toxin [Planctomycetes bacterium]|nr:type II toxin-antitoxin system VapC family toxin [Planctomycetota bacterium]
MLAVVDTNVLVYSCYPAAPHYNESRTLVEPARATQTGLCITPQIVSEFYAVVTNLHGAYRRNPDEVINTLNLILSYPGITVLPLPASVANRITELAQRRPVRGPDIHDLHIAATMIENGIRRIYTYDSINFQFSEIEAVEPPPPPVPQPPAIPQPTP